MTAFVLRMLYLALIGLWSLAFLQGAVQSIVIFDGPLWNGAFQHFNAIRRIHAGQVGGVDFQFFHGLGVACFHAPLCRAFGGDLPASEVARFVVNLLAYLVPYPVVFYFATRRFGAALGLTAVALVLSEPLGLRYLAWPSHNTPGVRAAIPFVILGALLAQLRPWREAMIVGVLTGLAFLAGTEHGLGSGLMLGATWVARRRFDRTRSIVPLALTALAAVAVALGGLVLIGGRSGAAGALHYAFTAIPADQFWYFGTPPLPYLGSWSDVAADQRLLLTTGAAATLLVLLSMWSRSSEPGRRLAPPLIGGLVYGMAASFGYFSYTGYQFHLPLIRIELAVALLIAWRAVEKLRAAEPARMSGAIRAAQFGFGISVLFAGPLNVHGPSSVIHAPSTFRTVAEGFRKVRDGECIMSERFAVHFAKLREGIEANRSRPGAPSIWSEYAGQLEAQYGIFHPSHDYIIHARGPEGSSAYLSEFRAADAEFAVTFHREYFPHVEKLQAADWGFYEELYANYDPIVMTSIGFLWKRKPAPWVQAPREGWREVALDTADAFHLEASEREGVVDPVVVLEVEYEIRKSGFGFLPVLGQSPRHLLFPLDARSSLPVAVRPYANRVTFPVALRPGVPCRFYAATRSLIGGRWTLKSVRARSLDPDSAKKYHRSMQFDGPEAK